MKKQILIFLSLILVISLLTACGSIAPTDDTPSPPSDSTQTDTPNSDGSQAPETPEAGDDEAPEGNSTVDLNAFLDEMNENYELAAMDDLDGELLANYYPGLSDYTLNQCVAKASMISAVVSEVVLVECASAEDAAAVAEILQARIDAQVDGGAWYPASIEQWEKAQLVTNGNYVAMIACGDNSASIAEDFLAKF